jgi:hypothetical protein
MENSGINWTNLERVGGEKPRTCREESSWNRDAATVVAGDDGKRQGRPGPPPPPAARVFMYPAGKFREAAEKLRATEEGEG